LNHKAYLLNYVIILFLSDISCLQLCQMFYRGQLCELDFQILDHKQRRRPLQISHQIYVTGWSVSKFEPRTLLNLSIKRFFKCHQRDFLRFSATFHAFSNPSFDVDPPNCSFAAQARQLTSRLNLVTHKIFITDNTIVLVRHCKST